MNARRLTGVVIVVLTVALLVGCGGPTTPDPAEIQRLVSEAVQATVSAIPTSAPAVTVKVETVVVKETVVVQETVIVEVVATATPTPSPSPTPVPTDTPSPQPPKPTPVPAAMPTKAAQVEGLAAVIAEFKAAGLEAEDVHKMAPDEYGLAPMVGEDAQRFVIPSLCSDCSGRVFLVTNDGDRARLRSYYDELAKASAAFFSWVFECKHLLLQINGDLPEEKARQYEAALSRVCEQ